MNYKSDDSLEDDESVKEQDPFWLVQKKPKPKKQDDDDAVLVNDNSSNDSDKKVKDRIGNG